MMVLTLMAMALTVAVPKDLKEWAEQPKVASRIKGCLIGSQIKTGMKEKEALRIIGSKRRPSFVFQFIVSHSYVYDDLGFTVQFLWVKDGFYVTGLIWSFEPLKGK